MSRVQRREMRRVSTLRWIVGMLLALAVGFYINDYLDARDQYNYCIEERWSECSLEWDGFADGWSVYWR